MAQDRGAVGLALAIRRLDELGSVLYITAHPDDENNALLAKARLGLGMRTGLLTLTRGEGGQNEIGPELGVAIGVLRTEEMLGVHRHDDAEQFFSRAYEFGYSFSVEETLQKWGKEETLGDIVRVIRTFRPDVIVTMMPTGEGGGQHHQASARLAMEARRVAADPGRFAGQIAEGLRPWRATRLFHAPFVRRGMNTPPGAIEVPVGEVDTLLGMSYAEHGAMARTSHRCQGMNALPSLRPGRVVLIPSDGEKLTGWRDGVASTLRRRVELVGGGAPVSMSRGLDQLQSASESVDAALSRGDRAGLRIAALEGLDRIRALRAAFRRARLDPSVTREVDFLLASEEVDWRLVAERAHFFACDARVVRGEDGRAVDGMVVAGETLLCEVELRHAADSVTVESVAIDAPAGWKVVPFDESFDEGARLTRANELARFRFRVTVATDAAPTGPHWHRPTRTHYRHATSVPDARSILPFPPPHLVARVVYRSSGVTATLERPVVHRWYDPVAGKPRSMAPKVVPELNVRIEPERVILPLGASDRSREVFVSVESKLPRPTSAVVRLEMPPSWSCRPSSRSLGFSRENESATVRFVVTPPAGLVAGDTSLRALVEFEGRRFDRGYRTIAYHHIETRHLHRAATATVQAFDVKLPEGLTVGYVMGVGDEVPAAIESLGARVEMLDAADLATGDLSRLDVIVTGVRAYKDRRDLISGNRRLLDRVAEGCLMLVQYNKYEFNAAQFGPYPTRIHRPHDRVTDERAPITPLLPRHQAFHWPNEISRSDWAGWVQERGLYFLGEWDSRYESLIELADSFPYNRGAKRGALVVARHGKGMWVYTGLGFFRQLPAGVPGAYRIFANLLSLGRSPPPE